MYLVSRDNYFLRKHSWHSLVREQVDVLVVDFDDLQREARTWRSRPAINASPLILLTKAGLLDLLELVNQEIIVPAAVATEIQQHGVKDVTSGAIASTLGLAQK